MIKIFLVIDFKIIMSEIFNIHRLFSQTYRQNICNFQPDFMVNVVSLRSQKGHKVGKTYLKLLIF